MAWRLSGVCSDVLVNNAGIMPVSPPDDRRVDDWHEMIDILPARVRSRIEQPADIDVNEIVIRPTARRCNSHP